METTLLSMRPQNILTIAVMIVGIGFIVYALGQGYSYFSGQSR